MQKQNTSSIADLRREISQKPPHSCVYIQEEKKKRSILLYTETTIYRIEMGWSQSEGRCKKHPKHTQSPGVCSSCLRERLSQLSESLSSSPPSSDSSVSASSESSPRLPPPLYLSSVAAAEGLFGRSRSVAVIVEGKGKIGKGGGEVGNRKKRGGFWSKLLGGSNRRMKEEGLLHSKTMKEAVPRS